MPATATDESVQTFHFIKEELVDAPIEIVFDAMLDELGPEARMPDGTSLAMKLEPWPGGRWIRDLGSNSGHLWGHVQVIKPPKLLEVCGPMFMSYPATNHLQYRLTSEGSGTRLKLTHRAFGLIPKEDLQDMEKGWGQWLGRIRDLAVKRNKKGTNR